MFIDVIALFLPNAILANYFLATGNAHQSKHFYQTQIYLNTKSGGSHLAGQRKSSLSH
jgi:hypothetical protein